MSFQSDLNQLESFEDISLDTNATTSSGQSAKTIFCNGWPSTKVVLESVSLIIKNPIAKIIIGIVIKAGDALSTKICTE